MTTAASVNTMGIKCDGERRGDRLEETCRQDVVSGESMEEESELVNGMGWRRYSCWTEINLLEIP